jgi:hypothetical protein
MFFLEPSHLYEYEKGRHEAKCYLNMYYLVVHNFSTEQSPRMWLAPNPNPNKRLGIVDIHITR